MPAEFVKLYEDGEKAKIKKVISSKIQQKLTECQINNTAIKSNLTICIQKFWI